MGPCKNVGIVDVKKTNGHQEERSYRVEYEAVLEVKDKSALKKLHETWQDEYDQMKAYREFDARIDQLQKEAEALRATVGPRPERVDFTNLGKKRDGWMPTMPPHSRGRREGMRQQNQSCRR